jgi:hypothetical protein
LGIGTNAPNSLLNVIGSGSVSGIRVNTSGADSWMPYSDGNWYIRSNGTIINDNSNAGVSIGVNSPTTARLLVKGSGSTSATTALLVQNSAGTQNLNVKDNGEIVVGAANSGFKYRSGVGLDLGQVTSSGGGGWIVQMWDDEYSKRYAVFSANGVQFGDNLTGLTNTSAQLSADSTTKGFLPPRMTTTQKNAISSPASGLMVYDTDTNKLCCYNGTSWNDLF